MRRIEFVGTWQGAGARRTLTKFNRPFTGTGIALYTDAWGPTTPAVEGCDGGDPVPLPGRDPEHRPRGAGRRAAHRRRRRGDSARGRRARRKGRRRRRAERRGAGQPARDVAPALQARLAEHRRRDRRRPADRPGRRAPCSGPASSSRRASSAPRVPRSAIGQLADGRIVLVAVDGRQPGYSVGMTNFELAQAMVRLGAVTGMAFDSGGSTTMAFNGTLLNRPSGPERADLDGARVPVHGRLRAAGGRGRLAGRRRRRRQADAALQARPPVDRDRAADARRTGRAPTRRRSTKQPGSYAVAFPPEASPPVAAAADHPPTRRLRHRRRPADDDPGTTTPTPTDDPGPTPTRRPGCRPPAQGKWKLTVSATDDVGQPSEMSQTFLVNSTAGFLATDPDEALPAPVRPRPPDPVEADEGRLASSSPSRRAPARSSAPSPSGAMRRVRRASPGTGSTARRRPSRAAGTSSASSRGTHSGRSISTVRSAFRRIVGAEALSRVPRCSSPRSRAR